MIEGVKFKITGGGKTYNVTTDANGYAELNDIKAYDENNEPITYTVTETDETLRYIVPAEQTTTVTVNRASVVKFDNQPKTGSIKINKQAEDGEKGGRTFSVTGYGKTYSAKTNKDGIAEFKELPVYDVNDKPIVYTISEKNVPLRYVTPASQKTTLTVDATVEKTFKNEMKKGGIKINKQADDGVTGGRTFTVTGNGQSYSAKTDKNGIAEFSELPVYDKNDKAIEYTISEKDVPVRYVVPADQKTTLIADATTEKTFKNESKKGTILINKQAEDGIIGDRTFEVSGNGKSYTDVTNKKGIAEFKELPVYDINDSAITYTISEKNVPLKYVVPASQTATLTADETVKKTFDNNIKKGYIAIITKTDITGDKEIPGAKMKLFDEDGNLIEEWVSTEGPHEIIGKLIAGKKYILHEESAPDGYVVAADIVFTVSETGEVDAITMKDDITKVRISKKDVTTDDELPGATLQIIDEDGNIVEEWVSASEPHFVEGKLISGKTYTLREITAPDGYEIANDIQFTVNKDGSVTGVVMYDEHTPERPPYNPPTRVPHTGADSDTSGTAVALALLAVGMLLVIHETVSSIMQLEYL